MCKNCKKQYVGSTVTKFRSRFNRYKSNTNLYGKGIRGCFQQCFQIIFKYNDSGKDVKLQSIDYCDPNKTQNVVKISGFIMCIWFLHKGLIWENWYYDSGYCLMVYGLWYWIWYYVKEVKGWLLQLFHYHNIYKQFSVNLTVNLSLAV